MFKITCQLSNFLAEICKVHTQPSFDDQNGHHLYIYIQWSRRFVGIPVEILVFASPTGYMFTSSGVPLDILYIPFKQSIIFLRSWTSTGSFANPTGSSVTNYRFSAIIDVHAGRGLEIGDQCDAAFLTPHINQSAATHWLPLYWIPYTRPRHHNSRFFSALWSPSVHQFGKVR